MPITLAAAQEPQRGWGNLLGLITAALLFYAFTAIHKRWKATQDNPSPADGQKALGTVNPQVTAESDSADSGRGVVVRKALDIDVHLAENAGKKPTTALVREAAHRFRVSESKAWRRYRRVTKGSAS
jgi:hypothetical protein